MHRSVRRHRQCVGINNGIHDHGPVLVRESLSQAFLYISGIFDANSLCTHGFRHLREVWVLEVHSERDDPSFLLLDVNEVQFFIVEDYLDGRKLSVEIKLTGFT